jgi:acyl-CoA reductase-like NAD-dependent aldehyde dehydrogenase
MASGCASVVKLPGQAAQKAALLASFCADVPEIPRGIVNFFIESQSEGSRLLVTSPKVPVISFTGSSKIGKEIAQAAAVNLKRVGLELGGKTPHQHVQCSSDRRLGERSDRCRRESAGAWRSLYRSDPRRRSLLSPDVP